MRSLPGSRITQSDRCKAKSRPHVVEIAAFGGQHVVLPQDLVRREIIAAKSVKATKLAVLPNGIIVSDDRRHLFVAASANMTVSRLTRGTADPEVASAKVAGMPDNLRWSADGKSILVGVHTEDPMQFAAKTAEAVKVGGNMYTTFNITRIDPVSMDTEIVMPSGLYGSFGAATGAIEVGNRHDRAITRLIITSEALPSMDERTYLYPGFCHFIEE